MDDLRIKLNLTDAMVNDTAAPAMDFLTKRLSLSKPELKKIVLSLPGVLTMSVEDNMEPKLKFLEKQLS